MWGDIHTLSVMNNDKTCCMRLLNPMQQRWRDDKCSFINVSPLSLVKVCDKLPRPPAMPYIIRKTNRSTLTRPSLEPARHFTSWLFHRLLERHFDRTFRRDGQEYRPTSSRGTFVSLIGNWFRQSTCSSTYFCNDRWIVPGESDARELVT